MSQEQELEIMRANISCAAVLEWHGWRLDKAESTKNCLKYRRGEGEIVLVNHGGKGWWDPCSPSKGDVFNLMQFLEPGLNFGQVRHALRPLIGMTPSFPLAERQKSPNGPTLSVDARWRARVAIVPGSRCWRYLSRQRGLSDRVIEAAIEADVIREGPYGSVWFAHINAAGELTGYEMRGSNFKKFSAGGEKTLFRVLVGEGAPTRIVITEAPIDALSVADVEGIRADTEYIATTGGLGPGTLAALESLFGELAKITEARVVTATDADAAGHQYATRLREMAQAHNLQVSRRLPPKGAKDWNAYLQIRGTPL